MQDTPTERDLLAFLRPQETICDRDRATFEKSPARHKYVVLDDISYHSTATPLIAGPSHFHDLSVGWACERADLAIVEAGYLGADSEQEFRAALELSRFVICVRTFQQRADKWSRALRPYLPVDVPLFLAVLPAKLTDETPDPDKFENIFRVAFAHAGRTLQ